MEQKIWVEIEGVPADPIRVSVAPEDTLFDFRVKVADVVSVPEMSL